MTETKHLAQDFVQGYFWGEKLCEAMGIDTEGRKIKKIELHCEVDGVVKAVITEFVNSEQIQEIYKLCSDTFNLPAK